MPNPQQPELRRSAKVPALDPDASEAKLSAERQSLRDTTDPRAPVPDDQRKGHHPEHDQDKPDLDAFAERLGVVSEDDEPDDAPRVEEDRTAPAAARRAATRKTKAKTGGQATERSTWSPIGLALAGPVTGFLIAKKVVKAVRRRLPGG